MVSKVKFELEFPIHASPNMLYGYIATPSGLEKWFADSVNFKGKIATFGWDGNQEDAKILSKKSGERIKYKWIETKGDESYFEFRIQADVLTKDISLMITDFAEDQDEVEESKILWEKQIEELKHIIGG